MDRVVRNWGLGWSVAVALAAAVVFLAAAPCGAEAPAEISIEGQLAKPDGSPLTGERACRVRFFDAAADGNQLGADFTGTVLLSSRGLFSLALTPDAAALDADALYYELAIDTDDPANGDATDDVFPERVRVLSVPFALRASEAEHVDAANVGDGSVDDTELATLDGVTASIQTQLDAKADAADTYTKTEVDTALGDKADAADTYTKTEVDTALGDKADAADTYTKSEVDTALADKSDTGHGHAFTEITGEAADAQIPDSITIDQAANALNLGGTAAADYATDAELTTGLATKSDMGHGHNLQDLGGAVTDAQVPDTITIDEAGNADTLDGQEGSYYQDASNLNAGTVPSARLSLTDADIPDDITVTEADTLADVTGRGASTTDAVAVGALTADTLDTGQGANELFAMDQDVQTTDSVSFAKATVGTGPATEAEDQTQTDMSTTFGWLPASGAQVFRAGMSGALTQCQLYMEAGTSGGDVVVGIYSGDTPGSGSLLSSEETVSVPYGEGSPGEVTVTFTTAASVTALEYYYIQITYTTASMRFTGGYSSSYAYGNVWSSLSGWTEMTKDIYFKTYVRPDRTALDVNGLAKLADHTEEPADSADRLYQYNGGLYWEGSELATASGVSIDKDKINDNGTLGFDWTDGEVSDTLTIGSGGTVDTAALSGTIASGNLSLTDADVPDTITVDEATNALQLGGTAAADYATDAELTTGLATKSDTGHAHAFSEITGTATDAQVAEDLTISSSGSVDPAAISGAVAVAKGGTGATDASGARSNLGLGTLATQNANSVTIGGGAIDGTPIGATSASTGVFTTVDTGQGANELYAMDQDVQTTDDVTFNSVTADTGTFGTSTVTITDDIIVAEGGKIGVGVASPTEGIEVQLPAPAAAVDQSNTSIEFGIRYTDVWQSFTAGVSGTLTSIDVGVYSPSLSGATLRIYEGEGTGGALLHTQSITSDAITSYVSLILSGTVSVVNGNQYTFQLSKTSENFGLYVHGSDPYAGGTFSDSGYDMRFRTYVATSYAGDALNVHNGSIKIQDSTDAPATTTDRLYNNGGTLYWSGAALGGSSFDNLEVNSGGYITINAADLLSPTTDRLYRQGDTLYFNGNALFDEANAPTLDEVTDAGATTTNGVTVATVDTGQGANELYAMDQDVQTTDDVTFNSVTAATGTFGTSTVTITDDITVADGGKVGIGTESPAGALQVAGGGDSLDLNVEDTSSIENRSWGYGAWQSFKPTVSGNLTAIAIKRYSGATDDTRNVRIYEGAGIGGSVISTTSSVVISGTDWTTITLSSPVAVTAGQSYTWEIGDSSDFGFDIVLSKADVYADGNAGDNVGNGNSYSTWDFLFRTYMESAPTLFADSGNVGIGTDSPAEALDVNGVVMVQDTTDPPSTTTDRLYNNGGNLYWNGTQLDAEQDTIVVSALSMGGTNDGRDYWQHKMRRSGSVVAVDAYVRENYHDVNVKINGSSIFIGDSAFTPSSDSLTDNTSNIDSSANTFSSGDTLAVYFSDEGSFSQAVTVTITVEYD